MGFWQNVDSECEYRGISRKELAKAARFSVNTISSGIKRNGMPEADLAVRIAKVLDVPLEKLLGIESELQAIDRSAFKRRQELFALYLPYITKIEQMMPQFKKSLLMLIENAPV